MSELTTKVTELEGKFDSRFSKVEVNRVKAEQRMEKNFEMLLLKIKTLGRTDGEEASFESVQMIKSNSKADLVGEKG